jgi:acyl carrier protein
MTVRNEIYAKVSNVLMEALAVDRDQIRPRAALHRDLAADSLDLLEIMFRLEQEFEIEIPRGELFPDSTFKADPEWLLDGKLTEKGLAELRTRLPFASLRAYGDDQPMEALPDLLTVGLVVEYVAWKLGPHAGRNGSHSRAVTTARALRR